MTEARVGARLVTMFADILAANRERWGQARHPSSDVPTMKPITRNPEVDELAASMVINVAAELMLDSLGPDDVEDPAALGRGRKPSLT
jgi:hypothetical protein